MNGPMKSPEMNSTYRAMPSTMTASIDTASHCLTCTPMVSRLRLAEYRLSTAMVTMPAVAASR